MSNMIVQPEQVKVGDIFYGSWGYEQTNIDFLKVIKLSKTGKTCQVIGIGQKTVQATSDMSETVAPDPENEIFGTISTVKITQRDYSYDRVSVPEIVLRGSYYYCNDSKHLGSLYRYKHPMYQSHYA